MRPWVATKNLSQQICQIFRKTPAICINYCRAFRQRQGKHGQEVARPQFRGSIGRDGCLPRRSKRFAKAGPHASASTETVMRRAEDSAPYHPLLRRGDGTERRGRDLRVRVCVRVRKQEAWSDAMLLHLLLHSNLLPVGAAVRSCRLPGTTAMMRNLWMNRPR